MDASWRQRGRRLPALDANSAPSLRLLKTGVRRGRPGLAFHKAAQEDQGQKKAELERGFLARESQGKKDSGVPPHRSPKATPCLDLFNHFLTFLLFCFVFSSTSLFPSSFTFPTPPGSKKNSILTQTLQFMSLRVLSGTPFWVSVSPSDKEITLHEMTAHLPSPPHMTLRLQSLFISLKSLGLCSSI